MRISQNLLTRIEGEAQKAYPKEACGFLIGTAGGDAILDAIPSPNLSQRDNEFQIDAPLHLTLQRTLRAKGQAVIGIYHSHPSGDSHPSELDKMVLCDPKLVWMITSVAKNPPSETRIFSRFKGKSGQLSQTFDENHLQITRFVA